jgi:hypothetical protein
MSINTLDLKNVKIKPKMTNLLSPEDIEWKFIMSMGFSNYRHSKYVNEKYGLEMEQITKKLSDGFSFGKTKTYFFIIGQ